jgi:hypothetical protein
MDGGDFISCPDNNNKEIGCASLHDVATAYCAYDADCHDYYNHNAHPNCAFWGGDCAVFSHPQQRMMGKMKKRGAMTMPTASIRGRAQSASMSTSPTRIHVYCHASTLSTPTASSPGSPRGDQHFPYARQCSRPYNARLEMQGMGMGLQQ